MSIVLKYTRTHAFRNSTLSPLFEGKSMQQVRLWSGARGARHSVVGVCISLCSRDIIIISASKPKYVYCLIMKYWELDTFQFFLCFNFVKT